LVEDVVLAMMPMTNTAAATQNHHLPRVEAECGLADYRAYRVEVVEAQADTTCPQLLMNGGR
jgi:hypothetical protein